MIDRAKKAAAWIADQQDWLAWFPFAMAAVLAAWHYLPKIDPTAGIDGLGFLFGLATQLLVGVMSCLMAWMCKRLYGVFKSDERIRDLEEQASDGIQHRAAIHILVLDRLELFAWLAFWFYCFSH